MSSRKGGVSRGPPAHQNRHAFKHNKNSTKTAKILASPNVGLCAPCHDKIEWRRKYRKYKPLSSPATCSACHEKTVKAAYHSLCRKCANERSVCAKCQAPREIVRKDEDPAVVQKRELEEERRIASLSEHDRRKLERQPDSDSECSE